MDTKNIKSRDVDGHGDYDIVHPQRQRNRKSMFFKSVLVFTLVCIVAVGNGLPFLDEKSTVVKRAATVTVSTPLGEATGVVDNASLNVTRFVVRYATQQRWQESQVATNWSLPAGANDPSGLPDSCPQVNYQSFFGTPNQTEDCLSAIIYVPSIATQGDLLPIFVWHHGGSYIQGSAVSEGLNGSAFAHSTNSIVVVIQYRLNVFGFVSVSPTLPGSSLSSSNLGLKDALNAVKFLNTVAPSFGGDPNNVNIAGQSSGANLAFSLLAVPDAFPYFSRAILHSGNLAFGFLTPELYNTNVATLQSLLPCGNSSNIECECYENLSTSDILTAATTMFNDNTDATSSMSSPMRPVYDGSFVQYTLTTNSPLPPASQRKPILMTFVDFEAGPSIYLQLTSPQPAAAFEPIVELLSNGNATAAELLTNSPFYLAEEDWTNESFDARTALEVFGMDGAWRCPGYFGALIYAFGSAQPVYVGVFERGEVYVDSEAEGLGSDDGGPCGETQVCHEGDIRVLFDTIPSPDPAQQVLSEEVSARWSSFMHNGTPNPTNSALVIPEFSTSPNTKSPSHIGPTAQIATQKTITLQTWKPVAPSSDARGTGAAADVHAYVLGNNADGSSSGEEYPVGACAPGFWGGQVEFLWQIYGL